MSEQEVQAMRAAVIEASRYGHDEGIKTAAEAVRMATGSAALIAHLRRDPVAGLNAVADALDAIASAGVAQVEVEA